VKVILLGATGMVGQGVLRECSAKRRGRLPKSDGEGTPKFM